MKTSRLTITEKLVKQLKLDMPKDLFWEEENLIEIRIGKYFLRISRKLK